MGTAPKTKNTTVSICPIAKVAELLGDTWVLLIIRDLAEKPRRFNDLASSLTGVSTRTLSAKLKKLQQHHLVTRQSFDEYPPRVEYTLTPRGAELKNIIALMRAYGEKHFMQDCQLMS